MIESGMQIDTQPLQVNARCLNVLHTLYSINYEYLKVTQG